MLAIKALCWQVVSQAWAIATSTTMNLTQLCNPPSLHHKSTDEMPCKTTLCEELRQEIWEFDKQPDCGHFLLWKSNSTNKTPNQNTLCYKCDTTSMHHTIATHSPRKGLQNTLEKVTHSITADTANHSYIQSSAPNTCSTQSCKCN